MSILVEWKNDNPVPVIDGRVRIEIPEYHLAITQKVTQLKSFGASYYDVAVSPDDDHKEILSMMLSTTYLSEGKFTYTQIYNQLKLWRANHGSTKEVKISPFKARISEMKRKGVFEVTRDSRRTLYRIRPEYAAQILKTGRY